MPAARTATAGAAPRVVCWGDVTGPRTIAHADMDAFFAAVEQREDPRLRGRPVAVGGAPPRGVVAAASYEARPFGVHSAMPTAQALQRCPELEVLPPRFELYAEVSRHVFEIFRAHSPLVEGLSLDEAFLDLTGTRRLQGDAEQVARAIKQRVRAELDLVVSIGIAPSKFVAKIASDIGKPDGLVVVRPGEVRGFLDPLPVSRVFGVGRVTQNSLARLGVHTIGQLAAFDRDVLVTRFGELGQQLRQLASGEDPRAVEPEREPRSIGHEDTFAADLTDLDELRRIVQEQADRVARRLRRQGYLARVVVLKAKTDRFQLYTRRRSLGRPTLDGGEIGRVAQELLVKLLRSRPAPLRLTGVSVAELVQEQGPRQLSFDEPEQDRTRRLARTLDAITDKYGRAALVRASILPAAPETRATEEPGELDD